VPGAAALRLFRQVLELQRQVGLLQLAARDLVLSAAAAGVEPAAPQQLAAGDQQPHVPAAPPGRVPPPPAGQRCAVAVDSSETARTVASRKATERTRRPSATQPAAKRQLRQLDLEAANAELAACSRAARSQW
jgi:hypothetical protein